MKFITTVLATAMTIVVANQSSAYSDVACGDLAGAKCRSGSSITAVTAELLESLSEGDSRTFLPHSGS